MRFGSPLLNGLDVRDEDDEGENDAGRTEKFFERESACIQFGTVGRENRPVGGLA